MQVFKVFFKVLKKKSFTALMFLVIFMSISVSMTKSESPDTMFEDMTLTLAVFDEDNTEESKALIEFLGTKHEIKTMQYDKDRLTDLLFYMNIDYAFTIEKGYGEKLANGETQGLFTNMYLSKTYAGVYMDSKLGEYTGAVRAYILSGCDTAQAVSKANDTLSQETQVSKISFGAGNENTDYPRNFSDYFRFMPYILMSMLLSALTPVLMTMNRKDIRFRTNCSCISTMSYTVQLFVSSAVFVIVIWAIFMIAGMFMYGGIYSGRAWIAVFNSLIFSLASAAIAVLVSTLTSSENMVNLIVQVLGLGMSFISGVFVLQSLLSESVLAAARFFPAYWYIKVNDMLAGRQVYDGREAAICLAIEGGFALMFGAVAMLITKLKREKAL